MSTFEKNGSKATVSFTISQEEIKPALTAAFNKVKKNLNVPGFRKGKVSRSVFDRMYGEEALYEEALQVAFPVAYEKALEEAGILNDVIGQPDITSLNTPKGSDWEITVQQELKPEVTLGQYKDLVVEAQDTTVTDEEVQARVEAERSRLADLVIKEDEAAVLGDTVVIDFVGSVDGVEFEGGAGTNHSLELGSGSFIPGFEEQLVGTKAGDEVEVNVTFPQEYQAEDLAGKDATFKTTVHEVKAKELPELDDEFAKDVDEEIETLDELKAKFRAELEANKKEAAQDARDEAAIRLAVENATIEEIPHSMVHDEVHNQMNQFFAQMQQQGISQELYYQLTGTTSDDLHKQYEETAQDRVRTNLVIEAITKAENFEATEEEVEKEVTELAEMYNMDVNQVKRMLTPEMLKHDIAMKKALELVTSTVKDA
ncbi:MAG: trigger factor [Streptococcaceae bacterium]|jgi:trigger factor|nr:trigger factor [Streptococcaceae bacterium]